MISGGRVVRDISGWMIVLYYDVGKEECVRMYASVMQPCRQLCIERRITLPRSILSLPYQKAKKRKVHSLRQYPSI